MSENPMQDYTMDLIEAAAYTRWLRDGIKPERDYPWYVASEAAHRGSPTKEQRSSVPSLRCRRGRPRREDYHS